MTNTDYPSATSENRPLKNKGNNNKNILIGVMAAILLISWGYFLYDGNKRNKKDEDTTKQNTKLTNQRDSLKALYNLAEARLDSITTTDTELQEKLTDRQKDINSLRAQIKGILGKEKATEAELNRAKQLIAQLNDNISGLEADVARLTGENQQLTSANTSLKQEKTNLETNLQATTSEKEELSKTVDVASTFSASNIQITPVNEKKSGKEKSTSTAKRVDKLVVSFDVENRIAKSGPADMYLIVTAPDGKIISDETTGSATLNTRTDGDKTFTAKIPIEYEQGMRKNIQFPIRQGGFQTGDYKIEIYHNGFKIGEGVRTLKKGGLFS